MFLRIVLMDAKQLQAVIDSLPPAVAAATASSASDAPKSVKLAAQDSRVEVLNSSRCIICTTFLCFVPY